MRTFLKLNLLIFSINLLTSCEPEEIPENPKPDTFQTYADDGTGDQKSDPDAKDPEID